MAVAPELIPEGELVLTRLLVPFMWLCCCIVGLAVANGADTFARAFFGTLNGSLGWIPLFGRLASRPIEFVAHKINSYISGWEHYFDARIGEALHSLAQLLHIITRDTYDTGETLYFAARRIDGLLLRLEKGDLFARSHARHAVTQEQVKPITRTVHEHSVRLAHTAPSAVLPRVKTVEGELGRVIEWDIPRLRARTRTIEKSLDRLWHRVRGLDKIIATTAFVGAVAVALGRLGLGWLRCPALGRIGKKIGCGGFGLLETLLSDAIEAFIVADLCDFVAVASDLAAEFEPLLIAFVDLEDALIGCRGATLPLTLDLQPLDLPATSAGLSLAA